MARLGRAGYSAKLLPKSYGTYIQVAPDGHSYRVDAVLDIGCAGGIDLYAQLFVIHDPANRSAYVQTSHDPTAAPGSTVVRDDRVYQISASHGEIDKVRTLDAIVTVAETGRTP